MDMTIGPLCPDYLHVVCMHMLCLYLLYVSRYGSVMQNYSSGLRSAGGNHTLTHPHRRMRVAPLNTQFADDTHQTVHM